MTITIDLDSELEARLQAAAAAAMGSDAKAQLTDLVSALPNAPTTAEILAGWDAENLPSIFGRDSRDATDIARELRSRACRFSE